MYLFKHLFTKREYTVIFFAYLLDTQYFLNTPLENRLFYIRKGRKDPKLADVLD